MKPIIIKQPVDPKKVANTLVSALEGGTGYWAQIDNEKGPNYTANTCDKIVAGKAHLLIVDLDTQQSRKLDRGAIEAGLVIMAKKYPQHFADMISENDDATTGDVLLQCALLGEVIYG